MAEREITERMIEEAVYNPERIQDGRQSRKIAIIDLGYRITLRVVYREEGEQYIVISAMKRRK